MNFYFLTRVPTKCSCMYCTAIHLCMQYLENWAWGMKCLNTRFAMPTLVCAGPSIKIKYRKCVVEKSNCTIRKYLPRSCGWKIGLSKKCIICGCQNCPLVRRGVYNSISVSAFSLNTWHKVLFCNVTLLCKFYMIVLFVIL